MTPHARQLLKEWAIAFGMATLLTVGFALAYSAKADEAFQLSAKRRHVDANGNSVDPRPGRWCMWWLRRHLGIPKSAFRPYEYNLARAGRYLGTDAGGPGIGVIVVWWHHIGIITGRTESGWIVKSGNDGGAVRERERSLKGAIAFRYYYGATASLEAR